MDAWSSEDLHVVATRRRRSRTGRRRLPRRGLSWFGAFLVVLVAAIGAGTFYWLSRPQTAADAANQVVVTSGGFVATIGARNTITVSLEIRNASPDPVTVLDARMTLPTGLTSVSISVAPTGEGNTGLDLEGDLPPSTTIELGTGQSDRTAMIAARFTVDCTDLLASEPATGEQIFVTVEQDGVQFEEELTPPVVDDLPWLLATARRACLDPVSTGAPEAPLSPLPEG